MCIRDRAIFGNFSHGRISRPKVFDKILNLRSRGWIVGGQDIGHLEFGVFQSRLEPLGPTFQIAGSDVFINHPTIGIDEDNRRNLLNVILGGNFPLSINIDTNEDGGFANLTKTRFVELFVQLFTCLLYTSPSPRDATLSRMPSSA